MTLRKVEAPEGGRIDLWLVEQGDVVTPGTPLAMLDIQGELRQIQSEYAGIVTSLKVAEGVLVLGHAILAVLDAFDPHSQREMDMVANTKLNRDIKKIVEDVVTPKFDEVSKRFNTVDKRLKSIDATLASINAKLDVTPPPPAKP